MNFSQKYREYEGIYTMTDAEKDLNNTKFNQIAVAVRYNAGGMNYFSGNVQPRCYVLSFKPCSISGGFRSSVMLGSGFDNGQAIIIKETKRYNAKDLEKLASKVDAQKVGHWFASGKHVDITELIESLRS